MRRGYYPFRTTPDEMAELGNDEKLRDELFHEKMLGTVERWMQMADEKLDGTGIRVLRLPGNDDQFEVDEIIAAAKRVRARRGHGRRVRRFQMVSTGWSNRTPWDTYREEDEDDLAEAPRADDLPGNRAAREDDLQLPLPALRHRPGRRPGANRGHAPQARRALDSPRRLDGRQGGDRGGPAGALAARAHPRGEGQHPDRAHALHQPRQLLRAGTAARRGDRPRRQARRSSGSC